MFLNVTELILSLFVSYFGTLKLMFTVKYFYHFLLHQRKSYNEKTIGQIQEYIILELADAESKDEIVQNVLVQTEEKIRGKRLQKECGTQNVEEEQNFKKVCKNEHQTVGGNSQKKRDGVLNNDKQTMNSEPGVYFSQSETKKNAYNDMFQINLSSKCSITETENDEKKKCEPTGVQIGSGVDSREDFNDDPVARELYTAGFQIINESEQKTNLRETENTQAKLYCQESFTKIGMEQSPSFQFDERDLRESNNLTEHVISTTQLSNMHKQSIDSVERTNVDFPNEAPQKSEAFGLSSDNQNVTLHDLCYICDFYNSSICETELDLAQRRKSVNTNYGASIKTLDYRNTLKDLSDFLDYNMKLHTAEQKNFSCKNTYEKTKGDISMIHKEIVHSRCVSHSNGVDLLMNNMSPGNYSAASSPNHLLFPDDQRDVELIRSKYQESSVQQSIYVTNAPLGMNRRTDSLEELCQRSRSQSRSLGDILAIKDRVSETSSHFLDRPVTMLGNGKFVYSVEKDENWDSVFLDNSEDEEYHHYRRFSQCQEFQIEDYPSDDDCIYIERIELRPSSPIEVILPVNDMPRKASSVDTTVIFDDSSQQFKYNLELQNDNEVLNNINIDSKKIDANTSIPFYDVEKTVFSGFEMDPTKRNHENQHLDTFENSFHIDDVIQANKAPLTLLIGQTFTGLESKTYEKKEHNSPNETLYHEKKEKELVSDETVDVGSNFNSTSQGKQETINKIVLDHKLNGNFDGEKCTLEQLERCQAGESSFNTDLSEVQPDLVMNSKTSSTYQHLDRSESPSFRTNHIKTTSSSTFPLSSFQKRRNSLDTFELIKDASMYPWF